jgi:hypothetical protein
VNDFKFNFATINCGNSSVGSPPAGGSHAEGRGFEPHLPLGNETAISFTLATFAVCFFYRKERNENAMNAKHDSSKSTLLISSLCGLCDSLATFAVCFFYRNERNENAMNAKHDSSKPTLLISSLCGLCDSLATFAVCFFYRNERNENAKNAKQ